MKRLPTIITLLSAMSLFAADFDAALKSGSQTNLSDEGLFKSKTMPSFGDNLHIKPHSYTENYVFLFDFPKNSNNLYGLQSLSLEVEGSLGLVLFIDGGLFKIEKDFVKNSQTQKGEDGIVAKGEHANIAMYPYYGDSVVDFKLNGNMELSDMSSNRTPEAFFGAYTTSGEFRNKSFFEHFEISGDLALINHKFAVATIDGINASIKGVVKFGGASEKRTGVLVLNHDKNPEGRLANQTLKVGGLVSLSQNAGIVSTITDAKKFVDLKKGDAQNPEYPKGKKLVGDEFIRAGTLEIVGEGGEFSGEIRDNFNAFDKRGRVSVVMNSPDRKQILSGRLSYTGTTEAKSGTLILSGSSPMSDVKISGGTLGFSSDILTVRNLNWSAGGFIFDFSKNRTVNVLGDINVSVIPEALDTFAFSNIIPRKAYTILSFENKKNALAAFSGKKLEFTDVATGKVYEAIFGASDTSLTVVFLPR